MTVSEDEIKKLVRTTLLRTLGLPQDPGVPGSPGRQPRPLITEADVSALAPKSTLEVPENAILTPLARQAAMERGIDLQTPPKAVEPASRSRTSAPAQKTVAIGADHGGYALKQTLASYVQELGYHITDCGTHSAEAVDYPDFAYAVAQLVADGRAWRGIMIDGAGIGSCMAANKVPGVRAAMCYDISTAINSREHNDANLLTLGAGLVGTGLAKQIVKVWLETDFGGGRHARRVNKITSIERRYGNK